MPNETHAGSLSASVPALTVKQRDKFLNVLRTDPKMGNVRALRAAGVKGTRGELRAVLDDDLETLAMEARGWVWQEVENVVWEVAKNPDHKDWQRTVALLAKAYGGGRFQDRSKVEVTGTGGGPVQIEKREVSISGVLHVLAEAGALPEGLAGPLRDLAAARELLPAHTD